MNVLTSLILLTGSLASFIQTPLKAGAPLEASSYDFHVTEAGLPNHTLRVKKHDPSILGIDTVSQYTGYLDIEPEDKHFFYWFFESRNDPKNDPIVLWLNGGPGCSSMTGLFFELGPSSIDASLKPIRNPYSWNNNASIFFIDQPVNVGFSYSSGRVNTTAAAAIDVYAFLQLFFKQFPEYSHLPFHLAGESYCGHYIPGFATEILSHGADAHFNLTSVLIGNGITDPLVQYDYFQPMACGKGGMPSVLSKKECDTMKKAIPYCKELISQCYAEETPEKCVPAILYCRDQVMSPIHDHGLNIYDLRKPCVGSGCYADVDFHEDYLNLPYVRQAIGAEVSTFVGCNSLVGQDFYYAGDNMLPYQLKVLELLDEYDLPVLLYAGDKDYTCNWLGNYHYANRLNYRDHQRFAKKLMGNYYTQNGTYAGKVKSAGKLTFLRVFDAGHMVPFDKPVESLDFFNQWISTLLISS